MSTSVEPNTSPLQQQNKQQVILKESVSPPEKGHQMKKDVHQYVKPYSKMIWLCDYFPVIQVTLMGGGLLFLFTYYRKFELCHAVSVTLFQMYLELVWWHIPEDAWVVCGEVQTCSGVQVSLYQKDLGKKEELEEFKCAVLFPLFTYRLGSSGKVGSEFLILKKCQWVLCNFNAS